MFYELTVCFVLSAGHRSI